MKLMTICAALWIGASAAAWGQDAPPPGAPAHEAHGGSAEGHGPRTRLSPRRVSKGFDLRMGEDVRLRVDCGDERVADCVAAVRPVIDGMVAMSSPRAPAP